MIGVYALFWESTGKVYIGRGVPIETRFISHKTRMVKGTHFNYKVQKEYDTVGLPTFIVIEECSIDVCASKEASWILEFDSVNTGLNLVYGDTETYNGIGATNSKYSKMEILKVFSLLYKGKMLFKEIASRTKVNISLCTNICYNGQHSWLREEYPDKYTTMLKQARNSTSKKGTNNPMSKYSTLTVLKVFSLLYRTKLSREKIAKRVGLPNYGLPKTILAGSHIWLKEKYPLQYLEMQRVRGTICKKYGY